MKSHVIFSFFINYLFSDTIIYALIIFRTKITNNTDKF